MYTIEEQYRYIMKLLSGSKSIGTWKRVRATQAIADIQRESVLNGTDQLSMKDIDAEIAKVRLERRKSID